MSETRKKIALCGTYYTESVGDALLFECVKYLYKKNAADKDVKLSFKVVDTYGRDKFFINRKRVFFLRRCKKKALHIGYKILRKIQLIFQKTKLIDFDEYYLKQFQDCDLIVVAGGGLFKYSVGTNFVPFFTQINTAAKKLGIPVVYNAIGIEGIHNPEDIQFEKMRIAFNESVKLISCRERFDVLQKYFGENLSIGISMVADTGVWAKETFRISKMNSEVIGINPVSAFFFNLYDKAITEEKLLDLWTKLIIRIDALGYKIQIFTNGNDKDYFFAKEIYEFVRDKNVNLIIQAEANNPKEMMRNISQCKYIIASRLHTCICAYSLDIPVIGLAWNNKLLNWSKVVQTEDYFFDVNEFDVDNIVDKFESLETFCYDSLLREKLKESINVFVGNSVDLLLNENTIR